MWSNARECGAIHRNQLPDNHLWASGNSASNLSHIDVRMLCLQMARLTLPHYDGAAAGNIEAQTSGHIGDMGLFDETPMCLNASIDRPCMWQSPYPEESQAFVCTTNLGTKGCRPQARCENKGPHRRATCGDIPMRLPGGVATPPKFAPLLICRYIGSGRQGMTSKSGAIQRPMTSRKWH